MGNGLSSGFFFMLTLFSLLTFLSIFTLLFEKREDTGADLLCHWLHGVSYCSFKLRPITIADVGLAHLLQILR